MKIEIFVLQFEATIKKLSMLQSNNKNCDVYLPNCNNHAKFERVLPIIY